MDLLGLIYINDWFLLFGGLIAALYIYSTWKFNYWTKQGVPGPKPLPFYLTWKYFLSEGFQYDNRLVKEYGDTVGAFEGREPYLITTDDDILREVFIKQFPNFANRREAIVAEESGLRHSVLLLKDDDGWKNIRDLLSPTFSSGKLKQLTGRMNDSSEEVVKKLEGAAKEGKIINLKEEFGEAAMSLIASVAFGIDLKDKELYNEFSEMGRRILGNQQSSLFGLALFVAPRLTTWLTSTFKFEVFDSSPVRYFGKIVDQVLDTRTKGDRGVDFIQLMANANKDDSMNGNSKQGTGMTRKEIQANGTTFFLGGFDPMSSGLTALFYQLALHPEAQEKVYQEVAALFAKKDRIHYDDLHELKYMDWCFNEALRMMSGVKLERKAKNTVEIKGIKIEKDMLVSIPVWSLHFDERRWKNPYIFRPERFSEEEKKDRSPLSWLPFGYGPRNCIGMRLAQVQTKIIAAHILNNFIVETCSKTQVPYVLHKFGFVGEGMDVKLSPRKKD